MPGKSARVINAIFDMALMLKFDDTDRKLAYTTRI